MIGVFDETFYIRESKKKGKYEVAKFGDTKRCIGGEDPIVHEVTYSGKRVYCDCPGYRWHRNDPMKHKHVRLVAFWVENLECEPGYVFWFDGDDIEYRKAFNLEELKKYA